MGNFSCPFTLISALDTQSETLVALVDRGATFTSVPGAVLERLGGLREKVIRLILANGSVVEHAIGEVVAKMDSVRMTIISIFGPEDVQPLISAHTSEAFILTVDPVE